MPSALDLRQIDRHLSNGGRVATGIYQRDARSSPYRRFNFRPDPERNDLIGDADDEIRPRFNGEIQLLEDILDAHILRVNVDAARASKAPSKYGLSCGYSLLHC